LVYLVVNFLGFRMADDKFSKEESERRFKAALLGARIAGHKPMESLIKKKPAVKKKAKKKQTK
jgi:hypothetical protein